MSSGVGDNGGWLIGRVRSALEMIATVLVIIAASGVIMLTI